MTQEKFWAYQAPAPQESAPPDCRMTDSEWLQLTPGYRREIWRDYNRRQQTARA